MKTVSIKDIAKETGLSITAVSLILNNKSTTIPQETINRVKEVALKTKCYCFFFKNEKNKNYRLCYAKY